MIATGELREIEAKIVGKEHGVGAAEEEGSGPVPPAGEEAPSVAKGGAHPAIEAALHGHGGGEFGGHEGDRDAPEEGNEQVIEQGHAGAGVADLLFKAEGATGGVGVHDENEREKGGFGDSADGLGWSGGVHGMGHNSGERAFWVVGTAPLFQICSF